MNTEIHEYLEKKKLLQKKLLDFVENDANIQDEFKHLIPIFKEQKIPEDKCEFHNFLCLISMISENHHRNTNFLKNIEHILLYFADDMKNNFSNLDIFKIFRPNKRIVFFLIQNKMIIIDKTITSFFEPIYEKCPKYCLYIVEMGQFLSNKYEIDSKIMKYPKNEFNKLREIGENNKYICELIRKDLIDDFIEYTKDCNISLDTKIKFSTFDTNNFLEIYDVSLIKYAAFFGSFKIFKYLFTNIKYKEFPWKYAIHGKNMEILHFLKQYDSKLDDDY